LQEARAAYRKPPTRTFNVHLNDEIARLAAVPASNAGMTLTDSAIHADAGFHVAA
jgi:hypothetical protein